MTKKKTLLWSLSLLVILGGGAVFYFRDRVPVLTAETYSAAKSQWETRGLKDYEMDVEVSGVQHGKYRISVKGGDVVKMTEDGIEVPERVWTHWGVKGMFRFLEEELASRKHPSAAYGVSEPESVYLHARFDPKLGYPTRFLRQVFGRKLTVEWRARIVGEN
ncbi:MAG: hypothetical protein KDD51_06810 [Bdellovibrionales bacterium]|nr:hypothetical protein [Bdellovibrionales bacterium]